MKEDRKRRRRGEGGRGGEGEGRGWMQQKEWKEERRMQPVGR